MKEDFHKEFLIGIRNHNIKISRQKYLKSTIQADHNGNISKIGSLGPPNQIIWDEIGTRLGRNYGRPNFIPLISRCLQKKKEIFSFF